MATNALLERKGARHAFVTTKGFRVSPPSVECLLGKPSSGSCSYASLPQDLLRINNQARPDIFALNVRRPEVLYESVLEIDERVTLVGYTYDTDYVKNAPQFDADGKLTSEHEGEIVQGVSGEAVQILRKPGESSLLS